MTKYKYDRSPKIKESLQIIYIIGIKKFIFFYKKVTVNTIV